MKRISIILLVVLVTASFVVPAHSQKKVAQTGLQFLKVDVSPRASAMGGAYTLAGDDASAMFSNPAGIALETAPGLDVYLGRIEWIADISYNAAAVMKNFGSWGVVGLSFMNADYGDIIGTRVAPTEKGFIETGNVDVSAYALGLSYARALTNKFTIGAQVKYAYQHLGGNTMPDGSWKKNDVDGLAYDFGTIFYPGFKSFRFGMSIRNFSADYKYQEEEFGLPMTFRIGVAMDVLDFMGEHTNPLLVSIDAIHPRDYTERINIGAEYLYMDMFALRGGYRANYDEEGLTAGLGVKLDVSGIKLRVDYSYADFGVFDSVNRFAFGFSF